MVFDKRGRYYAPMMLIVLFTMTLYLIIEVAAQRRQTARGRAIRAAMFAEESRYQSPTWGMTESLLLLHQSTYDNHISPYDELFINLSDRYNTDWRLMSAIGYCESRFMPYAKSYGGAVGIMQIMPRTGRIYGYDEKYLTNPEHNIEIANIHYKDIERMLRIPSETSFSDRASLILASYNGGIGHVFDAMRLARSEGHADPHLWSVVRRYIALLRLPEYYERECVYCGRFNSAYMTIRYVEDVMKRYRLYCEQTAMRSDHLYPVGDIVYQPRM